jgi:hypothetical protein
MQRWRRRFSKTITQPGLVARARADSQETDGSEENPFRMFDVVVGVVAFAMRLRGPTFGQATGQMKISLRPSFSH